MHEDFYIELIYKDLKGEISSQEKAQLTQWLSADKENAMLQEEIILSWQLSEKDVDLNLDIEADLKKLKKKLQQPAKVISVKNLWPRRLAIAASFLFLATASYWVLNTGNETNNIYASQDEIKVIDLLDGSKVWLNKNSKLNLSKDFSEKNRDLSLTGEAFFQVEKNTELPFTIKTEHSTVTVMGTSFNVKERKNKLTVTVESGKVRLSDEESNSIELVKGEIGLHEYKSNTLSKNTLDSENAESWKSDKIKFSQKTLTQVINELELLYNTNITLDNPDLASCKMTVLVYSTSFPVVLEKICNNLGMQSEKIAPNTIRLINGSCQ